MPVTPRLPHEMRDPRRMSDAEIARECDGSLAIDATVRPALRSYPPQSPTLRTVASPSVSSIGYLLGQPDEHDIV